MCKLNRSAQGHRILGRPSRASGVIADRAGASTGRHGSTRGRKGSPVGLVDRRWSCQWTPPAAQHRTSPSTSACRSRRSTTAALAATAGRSVGWCSAAEALHHPLRAAEPDERGAGLAEVVDVAVDRGLCALLLECLDPSLGGVGRGVSDAEPGQGAGEVIELGPDRVSSAVPRVRKGFLVRGFVQGRRRGHIATWAAGAG